MGDLDSSQHEIPRSPQGAGISFNFPADHDIIPGSAYSSPELNPTASLTSHEARSQDTIKPFANTPHRNYPMIGSGEGCESCIISIPESTSRKLPVGAPGSPKADGKGKNGSPILRSREALQVYGSQQFDSDTEDEVNVQQSSPESFASGTSASFFHKHDLIYISRHSPHDPNAFPMVRRATIHTLSFEQLPRGMTAGELSFGDPVNGQTIAYKFRLSDPHARGGNRQYALLAHAGHDQRRAWQVTTAIWTRFRRIAASIMAKNEKTIERSRGSSDDGENILKSGFMPVSSFLTGRTYDPDGYPRNHGGTKMRARGLTEMIGDERFFADLHLDFIGLLRDLRWRFGG